MPSSRASFCRGLPPEIVICVPKPYLPCPEDCVRAVATPGSRAAKSEAERPFNGNSVTFCVLTTPLTVDEPACPFPACNTKFATASASARIITRTLAESRSEEHTSELQSRRDLVCRLLLEKKKKKKKHNVIIKHNTKT